MFEKRFLRMMDGVATGDIEIIGGPINIISSLSIVGKITITNATFETISEVEAYKELLACKSGSGCYIPNPFNIIDDEHRRQAAYDNLLYLCERLGFGGIWHPVPIEPDLLANVHRLSFLN